MQIEFLAFVFDWFIKRQLNLLLFLSDWYCRKLGLTDLPSHDEKVTLDKKIISISHQVYKGGNRDYWSHFSVTFETAGKFLIVFVRLILGEVGIDGFSGSRQESDIRYEFDLKVVLKVLGCKQRFLRPFLAEVRSNN